MSDPALDNIPLTDLLALAKQGLKKKLYQQTYTKEYYQKNPEHYMVLMRRSRYTRKGYKVDDEGYPIDDDGNRIQLKRGRPRKDSSVCQSM